jgi:hypothetical protein
MISTHKPSLLLALPAVVVLSLLFAHEVEPVCAVIEMDSAAQTWINGVPHSIDSSILEGCPHNALLIVAPDFSAPAGSFVETVQQIKSLGRPVKYLFPASRRQFGELFGLEPISYCRAFSTRHVEPIPIKGTFDPGPAVRILRKPRSDGMPPEIDRLVTSATSSFGLVDDVAESHGAYAQAHGVELIVESGEHTVEIRLHERDFYLPPPPVLERHPDDRVIRGATDEFTTCVYPDPAKR